MHHDGELILITGALLAGGLVAGLLAHGLRVPSLVLVLGLGMAIGSDGTGWINFNDYISARTVGTVGLGLILFEGGMAAGFSEIRSVLAPSVALAVFGTLGTAVVTGLAAAWLFDIDTTQGMLIGSIVAATDGAAVFAVLRGSTLRRRLARTLEAEAGLNDPVAVLLVLGFIDWIQKPDYGAVQMLGLFGQQLAVGLGIGLLAGAVGVWMLPRLRLASAGLYPVASLSLAALSFGAADVLHGSGFLAVYLTGLALGSTNTAATRTMAAFHDGLAWLAQVTMFLVLGLLVFPSHLDDVWLKGTVLALVATVVARPLATIVVGAPFGFSLPERAVLGWAGLRGAVPVVLATFPVIAGVPGSTGFFNIAFFAVVLSTVVQGATFELFAKRLGVTSDEAALPAPLMEHGTIRRLGAEVVEFPVGPDDAIVGRRVRELGLPREALLNVIVRGVQAIPPRGSIGDRGRRSPPRARPPGGRDRVPAAAARLARGPARTAAAAPLGPPRRDGLHDAAVGRRRRRSVTSRERLLDRCRRAAADAARQARRGRRPRRRPLRRDRRQHLGRLSAPARRRGAAADARNRGRKRARLVARGRGRADRDLRGPTARRGLPMVNPRTG